MKELSIKRTLAGFIAIATLLIATVSMGVSAAPPAPAAAAKPGSTTIVGIVLANDGEYDVLQAAVVKAGLVDALNGKRQYTVFAPTDAAFVSTLSTLDKTVTNESEAIEFIESLPKVDLQNILLYHVMPGRHISTSVLAKNSYRMLNGDRLTKAELLTAGIAKTDISASNGVVHVINSVLIP